MWDFRGLSKVTIKAGPEIIRVKGIRFLRSFFGIGLKTARDAIDQTKTSSGVVFKGLAWNKKDAIAFTQGMEILGFNVLVEEDIKEDAPKLAPFTKRDTTGMSLRELMVSEMESRHHAHNKFLVGDGHVPDTSFNRQRLLDVEDVELLSVYTSFISSHSAPIG